MSKTNFQFHATHGEIVELIKKSVNLFDLYMVSVELFPTFQCELILKDEFENKLSIINQSRMIFLSKIKPNMKSHDYVQFLSENKNSLIFQIGEHKDGILKESSIGSTTEDTETLKIWKTIVNGFKKTMLKGAWVINPHNGAKGFYKNHNYTSLAQKLYNDGCKIVPIAGWNQYILSPVLEEK